MKSMQFVLATAFLLSASGVWAGSQTTGHGEEPTTKEKAHGNAAKDDAAKHDQGTKKQKKAEKHGSGLHWTYAGKKGPDHWGDLAVEFRSCKSGNMQSPIDLGQNDSLAATAEPIQFDYRVTPLRVVHMATRFR